MAKLFFDLTFGTCIVGSCRLDRATLETTALGLGDGRCWKLKDGLGGWLGPKILVKARHPLLVGELSFSFYSPGSPVRGSGSLDFPGVYAGLINQLSFNIQK